MQVDNVVIVFKFQFFNHQFPTMSQYMQLVDIRIVLYYITESFFYKKMYFGTWDLFFSNTVSQE